MAPVVEAVDVSFAYDREPILLDVGLAIGPGEFVALVGPNGSGKSTLLKVLLGLLAPASGSVRLFGVEPSDLRDRGRIGYVPQRPTITAGVPATVEETVAAGRLSRHTWWKPFHPVDRREVVHAMASVGVGDLRARRLAELSGGQQQRAFIARAFASQPDLLVLDEPIAGVDVDSQRLFRDSLVHLVAEHGAAVLLVSHELGAVAADLDRVLVLKRTIVFDGAPSELAAAGVSLGVHAEDLPIWLEELR